MSAIPYANLTVNQKWWRENYHSDRKHGMGCHAMGSPRRSGHGLTKTKPTEGSKTQKRKQNYGKHTPFKK